MERVCNSLPMLAERRDKMATHVERKSQSSGAQEVLKSVQALSEHDSMKHGWNSKGNSLLEMKNKMMMQYMLDLTLLLKAKASGQSIKGHPAIWRLIETRIFLEKTFSVEQKLKYEIQKLVKRHRFGDTGESDGLKYKPNPDRFDVQSDDESEEEKEEKDDEEDSEEEEEDSKKKGKGLYKVPKVAPMPYTGDETAEENRQRKMEQFKRRARSSTMMDDIVQNLLDQPEEIVDSTDLHRIKADRKRKERNEYEEKYFVRTPLTKRDKYEGRKMATMSSLEGILKFNNNLSYLDDDAATEEPAAKKKKTSKGSKGKGKGKKGKGKRKWRH